MSAHHLVLHSGGASILTRALVEEDLSSGRLTEVEIRDAGNLVRSGAVVRLKDRGPLASASQAFLQILHGAVAEFAQ